MSGRSPALDGISFATLLAYRDGETARWRDWLDRHPAALDVAVGEGRTATVRGLIVHILAVELRYAERLLGRRVTTYEELEPADTEEVFAIGVRARLLIDEFLARADDDEMRRGAGVPDAHGGHGARHEVQDHGQPGQPRRAPLGADRDGCSGNTDSAISGRTTFC